MKFADAYGRLEDLTDRIDNGEIVKMGGQFDAEWLTEVTQGLGRAELEVQQRKQQVEAASRLRNVHAQIQRDYTVSPSSFSGLFLGLVVLASVFGVAYLFPLEVDTLAAQAARILGLLMFSVFTMRGIDLLGFKLGFWTNRNGKKC